MWSKMRWMKGYRSPKIVVDSEKASNLLVSLTPDYVSPEQPTFSIPNKKLEEKISMQELCKCIKLKDTSPGCDGISYSMVKNLPHNSISILLNLFNDFFASGFVPSQWRDIDIIAIPKPGRDPNQTSSLRPISLMSCLCKIFHSILNKRIEWFLEKHELFSENTVGFRKSRGCLNSLSCLVSRIQKGFSERLTTIGCFIDIDNAYNNVDVKILLDILHKLKVGSKLCQYIWNFLNLRNLKIQTNNGYLTRSTGRGLAQGDPLSPLLFNVATLDICKTLEKDIYIAQYADDLVLYHTCQSIDLGTRLLQNSLNDLNEMLMNLGLEISSSKSKVCVFKTNYVRQNVNLVINQKVLENVLCVKYLGIWLDRNLRWAKNINEIRQKTMNFFNIFKVLTNSRWGIHPIHIRRLYISIVRSRLDYASFLYDNSSDSNCSKLDKIQNQYLRILGSFIKSTPIHVMEAELFLQPLFVRRAYLAAKFWLKSKSLNDNLMCILQALALLCQNLYWRRKKTPLLVTIQNKFQSFPFKSSKQLEMFSLDTWISGLDTSSFINCTIPNVDKPKRRYASQNLLLLCTKYLRNQYLGFYKIFTDASKDEEAIGMAFLDVQTKEYIKLKSSSLQISIMFAELIAIAEALSYVNSIMDCSKFVIFTDSKSALQHLIRCTDMIRGIPLAYDILKCLHELKSLNKIVILQWIPSHIGIVGNEAVDNLAKDAALDGIGITCEPYFTNLICEAKKFSTELWSEYFDKRSLTKGIWYRTLQPSLPRCLWFEESNMGRYDIVTSFRLRSGHIPLNKFGFMMGKVGSPNCIECNIVEDVYHILMECVRNEAFRQQTHSLIDINPTCVGWCNSILSYPQSREAKVLYKLTQIGIKNRNK